MTVGPPEWPRRRAAVMIAAAAPIMLGVGLAAVWPRGDQAPEATVVVTVDMPRPTVTPRLVFPRVVQPPPAAIEPADVEPAAGPPIVADDTQPAWQRNAVQVALVPNRVPIAIVIDDMGLDQRRSARVVALPAPLTLAYITYAGNLRRQTANAARAGHELILHVPMEPLDAAVDAGPGALRSDHTALEILDRLEQNLARFDGFVGISYHKGSRFSADRLGMALVLTTIRDRWLLYLDSRTTPNSAAPKLAAVIGADLVERDVFLDTYSRPKRCAPPS